MNLPHPSQNGTANPANPTPPFSMEGLAPISEALSDSGANQVLELFTDSLPESLSESLGESLGESGSDNDANAIVPPSDPDLRFSASQPTHLLSLRPSPLTVEPDALYKTTLRNELLTSILPWVLAPVGAAGMLSYSLAPEAAPTDTQATSTTVGQSLRDRFAQAKTIPAVVAPDPTMIEFSRTANESVEANGVRSGKPKQALNLDPKINAELKRLAETANFSELLITDKTGITVASNRPTVKATHQDTAWWKTIQKTGQAVELTTNASGAVTGVEIVQEIKDPASGQFLGVVKGQLSADALNQLLNVIADQKLSGSQQVQLLAIAPNQTITSLGVLNAQGVSNDSKVGDAVGKRAVELITQTRDPKSAMAKGVEAIEFLPGEMALSTTIAQDGRDYRLLSVPGTSWVVVASSNGGRQHQMAWAIGGLLVLLGVTATSAIARSAARLSKLLGKLNQAFDQVSSGNLNMYVKPEGSGEVQSLTQSFNRFTGQMRTLLHTKSKALQQAQFYADMAQAASQGDAQTVFDLAVRTLQKWLMADRAVVYQFDRTWAGEVVAESRDPAWTSALHERMAANCIPFTHIQSFHKGQIVSLHDVTVAEISSEHRALLERLAVRSSLMVPILSGDRLLGLLIVHQCTQARVWKDREVTLAQDLATQMGNALTGLTLIEQRAEFSHRSQRVKEIAAKLRLCDTTPQMLTLATEEIRQFIQTDRVIVYRFHDDWNGTITAESVVPGEHPILGQTVQDPFREGFIDRYRNGRVRVMNDIYAENLTAYHVDILEGFQIRASIVAPILQNGELIGLLCAHHCSAPRLWNELDVEFFSQMAERIGLVLDRFQLRETARFAQMVNDTSFRIRDTRDRDQVFETVVHDLRTMLTCDRALIYLLDDSLKGTVQAESVSPNFPVILGAAVADPAFHPEAIAAYEAGHVNAIANIQLADIDTSVLEHLEAFGVKASLSAPIIVDQKLIGLLVVHQCSHPRVWESLEINSFRQLAIQLSFVLDQVKLSEQREEAVRQAEANASAKHTQTEHLQAQLMELLSHIEGAASGNLTVRADVVDGEIGIVADFFNSIIESLRQIVHQVKQSSLQVNASLDENEGSMQDLAIAALKQSQEIGQTLRSLENMTRSIREVASAAQQAADVARDASSTAEAGETVMELTVQNIMKLRGTVGDTAKKVKRLGESSQQISRVVALINQIALQTNMLAVNAGIEASRAGQEGQGFAIVAEEVSELAARASSATEEIEQIVETIQRETSEVVAAMEDGTAQVVEGTQLAANAKQGLEQIMTVSRQIDTLVQSISEATVSQVETSQEIAMLMENVAQVADRTSNSAGYVASSLRQTVAIAKELQESVETFTVG